MGSMAPVKPPDKPPSKPQISPPPPPPKRRLLVAVVVCLLGSCLGVPIAHGSNIAIWPPTGYVFGQPLRNLGRFCGDCQLRQAERVEKRRRLLEAWQAWRELDRRQREQEALQREQK